MQLTTLRIAPRPRTLIHPGKSSATRILHRDCKQGRHIRLALQPGLSLHQALVEPLLELGIGSASTTILGGAMRSLSYCVAPPDASGQAVICYTAPIAVGAAQFIFGNATVGKDLQGKPIVLCHGAFRMPSGQVKGGHVITDYTVIGEQPISVLITAFTDFDLQVRFDPETNIPLIQPQVIHHEQ